MTVDLGDLGRAAVTILPLVVSGMAYRNSRAQTALALSKDSREHEFKLLTGILDSLDELESLYLSLLGPFAVGEQKNEVRRAWIKQRDSVRQRLHRYSGVYPAVAALLGFWRDLEQVEHVHIFSDVASGLELDDRDEATRQYRTASMVFSNCIVSRLRGHSAGAGHVVARSRFRLPFQRRGG